MKILVIEDDQRIAKLLDLSLSEDGHRVYVAERGDEGLELIKSNHFDLAVLDVMLPGMDGLTLLKHARAQQCAVPVLVLSARDSMRDMVRGLDLGADDYLTKPFQVDNLLARVRAVGRRGHIATDNRIVAGHFTLDCGRHVLLREEVEVALSRKEFMILELLMRRRNQIVSRAQIIEIGWGIDTDVSDNSVDFYVSSLRSKLDTKGLKSYIRTVRAVGYSFSFHDDQVA